MGGGGGGGGGGGISLGGAPEGPRDLGLGAPKTCPCYTGFDHVTQQLLREMQPYALQNHILAVAMLPS